MNATLLGGFFVAQQRGRLLSQAMNASPHQQPLKALQKRTILSQRIQLDNRSLALFHFGLDLLSLINILVRATAYCGGVSSCLQPAALISSS
jgi:hypothetical protein